MTTFCFVAGLHRSGTSVLARSLGAHAQVSAFENTGVIEDEGQFLQSVYPPAREFGGPGKFGFEPGAYLDENDPLATAENATQLFREWRGHWDLRCDVLVEKSPPNLIKTRFLQRVFPGAHFVIVTRHPIATSLATQKWSRTTLESLIEHWLTCHERFRADSLALNHAMVLRYESLVGAPTDVLNKVQTFLDLPLEHLGGEIAPSHNERYFQAWSYAATDDNLRTMIWRCRNRFETRVQRFGYSLDLERYPDGICVPSSQRAA